MSTKTSAAIAVDTDRPELESAIGRLEDVVQEAGGRFLDGVYVRGRQGELTIASTRNADRADQLIAVPYACLPDTKSFKVRLDNGQFAARRSDDGPVPTDLQARAFDALLEIYNLMDKPTQWAAQTPWLTLWHDPDLLEHLVAAPNSQMAKPKLDLYREGRWDDVLIGTFLSSRVFNLKGKQKGAGQTQPGRVLMPFIDFLNHHFHARGFQTETAETWDDNKIFVYQDQPLEGSDQCFVMYSMLDCYASFLSYGFIDESAPFISSHPTTVELSQGVKLQVGRNLAGTFKKQLPQKMRDLRIYMPQVGAEGSNGIPVSRLLFPGSNAPRALRRVLATILRSKRPQWDAVTVEAAVREAERKLLDANHRHYDRLAELTAEARMRSEDEDVPGRKATLRTVDQLVFRSKRHLYAYADRLSD